MLDGWIDEELNDVKDYLQLFKLVWLALYDPLSLPTTAKLGFRSGCALVRSAEM